MLFESSPLPMWVFDAETLRFSRRTSGDAPVRYSRHGVLLDDGGGHLPSRGLGGVTASSLRRESGSVNRGVFRHATRAASQSISKASAIW